MTPFFDRRVVEWAAGHVPGCERGWQGANAMGVEHGGKIVAAIVFHNWNPECEVIEISGAATDPRWFTRKVINAALSYVFDDVKCQMLIARQRLDNEEPRRCWAALGADEVVIPRLYGREIDGTIMTLTEEQWRASKFYRRPAHGRQIIRA